MTESKKDKSGDSGCFGCAAEIVGFLLVWALLFGITIDGKHYGLGCSWHNGVEFQREPKQ